MAKPSNVHNRPHPEDSEAARASSKNEAPSRNVTWNQQHRFLALPTLYPQDVHVRPAFVPSRRTRAQARELGLISSGSGLIEHFSFSVTPLASSYFVTQIRARTAQGFRVRAPRESAQGEKV
jgi:hypothetical protein